MAHDTTGSHGDRDVITRFVARRHDSPNRHATDTAWRRRREPKSCSQGTSGGPVDEDALAGLRMHVARPITSARTAGGPLRLAADARGGGTPSARPLRKEEG